MASNFVSKLPVIGSFLDGSGDQAINELQQNKQLWDNLKTPDLQWTNIDPKMVDADMAQATTVKEDPSLVDSQMDVLNKMSGLANNGLSDVDQAAFERARQDAGQIAHQQTDAALENAQNRGLSGSGMEFAMREMAGQNAANSAQQADLQQAADAAKMRAMYNSAYGNQLAQVRGQNYNTAANNTNILNQFNQANTQARNQANYYNTGNTNDAQKYNLQGQMNTQQQNFNNNVTKLNGETGANAQVANGYAAQNAANTSAGNALLGAGIAAYTGMGRKSSPMSTGTPTAMAGEGYGDGTMAAAHGGVIPGVANVPGDSLMNDTVPAHLSPGEMVIPRSHAQTPHLAKAFVDHLFGKTK